MFRVCGTRGRLSIMHDGPAIGYDSTSLNGITDLYYKPMGICIFVGYQGLNDQATSIILTDCPNSFRDKIITRDGPACIVTRHPGEYCDTAHLDLVPWSKGDEYIQRVVGDLSSCYPLCAFDACSGRCRLFKGMKFGSSHLNTHENATIFKRRTMDWTPLTYLGSTPGQAHTDHFTLQRLREPENYNQAIAAAVKAMANTLPVPAFTFFAIGSNLDALFQGTTNENATSSHPEGTGNSLPPAIILDYMYGVAAYKQWGRQGSNVHDVTVSYHKGHCADIPVSPRTISDNSVDTPDPDKPLPASRRRHTSTRGSTMAKAVDDRRRCSVNSSVCGDACCISKNVVGFFLKFPFAGSLRLPIPLRTLVGTEIREGAVSHISDALLN
ncbi:hypothetical protein H4582DRAFT_2127212 [Lactarius indigo]|nr:hypothetical protein H4582DRAFT_2127212 [Lactarius indigo]